MSFFCILGDNFIKFYFGMFKTPNVPIVTRYTALIGSCLPIKIFAVRPMIFSTKITSQLHQRHTWEADRKWHWSRSLQINQTVLRKKQSIITAYYIWSAKAKLATVLGAGGEGVAPPAVRVRGIIPGKFLKTQIYAKSCILVTTCCDFFLLFENYGQEVGGGD